MNKIEKALAKLYFALGETKGQKPAEAGKIGENAECLAYLAIRNTGETLGSRYFAMGAASALRRAAKPPRGKFAGKPAAEQLLPLRGGKTEKARKKTEKKPFKAKRGPFKSENWSKEDFDLEGEEWEGEE